MEHGENRFFWELNRMVRVRPSELHLESAASAVAHQVVGLVLPEP